MSRNHSLQREGKMKLPRIGDTVTYRLELNLAEGVTENVQVTDSLPTGMVYDSLVGIAPASGSGGFTYSLNSQPAAAGCLRRRSRSRA